MTYLSREDVLLKMAPYGVSASTLSRLMREQGFPYKAITPRKVFFDGEEIDRWLSRRTQGVAQANTNHAKFLAVQRKRRRREKETKKGHPPLVVQPKNEGPAGKGV
jgi:predicted DNA-binding transcriptional regulator AlpA